LGAGILRGVLLLGDGAAAGPSITNAEAELARPDSRPQRSDAAHPANRSAPC